MNSPYRSLALALHETLHFEKRLYVEHDAGVVRCRFRVGRDGRLDSRSVRARSAERFLLVYFLQKLEGLFGEDQAERWHGEAWLGREVTVVAQFRAVRARDVRDPWPKIAGDRIELERRRHLPAKLQLGPAEIEALADGKSISGARVGLPLEIESWFSAAHRKRFGWSGTKVLETEERVWRETYDRLYERYVSRGWIEI